ncbi:MAG: hypothetical protein Q8K98_02250 [Bacteroidota bacterium]|nr:hypothetical protein [Bacteroidota bacterium]
MTTRTSVNSVVHHHMALGAVIVLREITDTAAEATNADGVDQPAQDLDVLTHPTEFMKSNDSY